MADVDHLYNENSFGPPSFDIDVAAFIQTARQSESLGRGNPWQLKEKAHPIGKWDEWTSLPAEVQAVIEDECNVGDLKSEAHRILARPDLSAVIQRHHETAVETALGIDKSQPPEGPRDRKKKKVQVSEDGLEATPKKKSRRTRPAPSLPTEDPDVGALRETIKSMPLGMWRSDEDAFYFIRKPRGDDVNGLAEIASAIPPNKSAPSDNATSVPPHAVVTIVTTYVNSSIWPFTVRRASTHALLSTQTLEDLFDCIPCPSKHIPKEKYKDGMLVGFDETGDSLAAGCVICINDVAYSDGKSAQDYAGKLIQYQTQTGQLPFKKGTPMHSTQLGSIPLRINCPHQVLHHGDCEHYFVIEQIRLLHPSDPSTGYPLTMHVTPVNRALCRICNKFPATLAIAGDVRIGEPVCLSCDACWKALGPPKSGRDDSVIVTSLVGGDMAP
ncbi:hypothetical protein BOTBODRAFT_182892 [Botryobasidium botryosum FD-172 SS1]|uniref:snRNA-activating protein complex subunit 3 n=1 Tax=Botryobasidium botryosum (strain FD-172 SS1) TaxID=930990 RepID=A0A067NBU3_BOTB1|nr:hypothetical protein BOTBODRAFT_182892 [Botryobasidium botryosum FD-172 SS1]